MRLPSREDLEAEQTKSQVDESIVRAVLARVPPSWSLVLKGEDGAMFRRGNIQVIVGASREQDGNIWIHVSACGRRGENHYFLPSFEDLKRVKHDFIGEDKWAYQVFPNQKDYVNLNPYVLHLFSLLEGTPVLPDFTRGLGII